MAICGTVLVFQCGSRSGSATDTSDTTKMAADQMDIDFANKAAVGGMVK